MREMKVMNESIDSPERRELLMSHSTAQQQVHLILF